MDLKSKINEYKDDIIKDTVELVKIKSVEEEATEDKPFGEGPYQALKKSLEIADKLGFKTVNLDNYCGYAEIGEGDEVIGLLGHVDVVPEGEGWDYDPYGGEIDDGKIYGRGTCDDKAPIVMSLYALKALEDLGVEFKKRVRVIIGANEESGFKCVEYYKKKEGGLDYGFSPDAAFPLIFGEKGIVELAMLGGYKDDKNIELISMKGGEAANVVAPNVTVALKDNAGSGIKEAFEGYYKAKGLTGEVLAEEGNAIILKLNGVSGHASTPETGKNAISYMFDFLGTIMEHNSLVNNYNRNIGLNYYGENCGMGSEDKYGKLTFNVGKIDLQSADMINKETGENLDEGKFNMTIDVRYPITKKFAPLFNNFKNIFEEYIIKMPEHKTPLFVDPESDLVKVLQESYEEVSGDKENKPYTIGGGTYSRAFKNVVAFGPLFPDEEETAHQKNEFIDIENSLKATEIFALATKKLLEI